MNSIETLISVLCDPEGKCCISGSDDDRRLIDSALAELAQAAQADRIAEQAAPKAAPAWADQAVIEYRYTGGTHWCPLGPAERMKPDFDGVYRLQAGVYPVEQAAPKAAPVTQQAGYAEVIECGNSYAKVKLKGEAFGSVRVGDIFYTAPQQDEPVGEVVSAQLRDRNSRAWPKVSGVSRDEGHSRALLVFFAAEPTDDEMRAVHDTLAAAPTAKAAPVKTCVCGEPQASGTVHRVDGPCYVAATQQEAQEPVFSVHKAHLKHGDGPWCREALLYSPDNTGENRVMLYTAPTSPAFVYAGERGSDLEGLLDGYDHGTAFYTSPQPAPDCHHRPPCDECRIAAQGGSK